MSDFFRKHGIFAPVLIAVLLAELVFFALYGERLNPFDGKTWSDFDRPTVKAAKVQTGSVLDTTRLGCEIVGPDGKPLTITPAKSGAVLIPKGSTINSDCFVNLVRSDE